MTHTWDILCTITVGMPKSPMYKVYKTMPMLTMVNMMLMIFFPSAPFNFTSSTAPMEPSLSLARMSELAFSLGSIVLSSLSFTLLFKISSSYLNETISCPQPPFRRRSGAALQIQVGCFVSDIVYFSSTPCSSKYFIAPGCTSIGMPSKASSRVMTSNSLLTL